MKLRNILFIVLSLTISNAAFSMQLPDPKLTPGVLCSASDPDFQGYDYPSHVARCKRNISNQEKLDVARNYGNIPQSQWVNYEFDHYMPLCAGGSNSPQNLWPQPIAEAKKKDVVEVQVCTALKAGTMTQDQALQKILDWFGQFTANNNPAPPNPISPTPNKLNVNAAAIDQAAPATPPVLINKKYECNEIKTKLNEQANIKINFELLDTHTIQNLQVSLVENTGENEILNSGPNPVEGKLTKSTAGPISNLILFSVKNNKDRFYFYLPQNFVEIKYSYFKISFEDSYPQLLKLSCVEK